MSEPGSRGPEERLPNGRFPPGVSGHPSGRPRRLIEIEAMLNAEFRDVATVREAFQVLKKLALQGVTNDVFDKNGDVCGQKTTYHPAYMQMLLDRLIGPVKESPIDLSDETDEALQKLREKLRQ
ncbi:MAG TPA: hypothetical protein VFY10_11385 [Dehalococcoidia bacterium]|nr:hypothetical protein [Dehalococcoidia bacterium]